MSNAFVTYKQVFLKLQNRKMHLVRCKLQLAHSASYHVQIVLHKAADDLSPLNILFLQMDNLLQPVWAFAFALCLVKTTELRSISRELETICLPR